VLDAEPEAGSRPDLIDADPLQSKSIELRAFEQAQPPPSTDTVIPAITSSSLVS